MDNKLLYRQENGIDFSSWSGFAQTGSGTRSSDAAMLVWSTACEIKCDLLSLFLLFSLLYHSTQTLQYISPRAVSVPALLFYAIARANFVNTSSDLNSTLCLINCGYCSHFSSPASLSDGPVSYKTWEEIISSRRKWYSWCGSVSSYMLLSYCR